MANDPMQNGMLQQLIQSMNSNQSQTPQTQIANPQQALQPFLNSPMYQLLYGNNANQLAQNGQYSPTAAFQADPGFAFNEQQTAKQMQQYGAARGLLESGPMQQALQNQLQGMQNQQYQTWLGQQNNLYNSYQGQLANLANMGSQNTGASQAVNSGNLLGSLLGGYNMQTGQGIAGANQSTGENISQLLANLGAFGGNAYLNTAAAQAGTLQNMFGMNAQLNNQAQSAFTQTQNSALQGQGALNSVQPFLSGSVGYGTTSPNGTYTGNPFAWAQSNNPGVF